MNTDIFKKIGLEVTFSAGVANDKTVFVPPCILLKAIKCPKIRFKLQNSFWKKYLKKTGRRSLKDMPNSEYVIYLTESKERGETKEYLKWRKYNEKKIDIVKKLIGDFNKIENKNSREITLLTFEDGKVRIQSGNQFSMSVFKRRGKMNLPSKKLMAEEMIKKLKSFTDFVESNL